MNNTVKSRGTWGRRQERSIAELNAIAKDFFDTLVLPEGWEFVGSNYVDCNGIRLSVGGIYRNSGTKGVNLMYYRVFFLTYSERGGICEKSVGDLGKDKYLTVVSNLTAEKLNEYIQMHYD